MEGLKALLPDTSAYYIICVYAHTCHNVQMETRGRLVEVGSLCFLYEGPKVVRSGDK